MRSFFMIAIKYLKLPLRVIRDRVIIILYYLFRVIPINEKKIVFSNYYGKGLGDNGKYIALEMLKRGDNYDIVWLIRRNVRESFPTGIRTVQYNSIQAIFEMATAKVWVDNC